MAVRRRAAGGVTRPGTWVVFWALLALCVGCTWLFTVRVGVEWLSRTSSTIWCSTADGSSTFGTASWSWEQLGTVCTSDSSQVDSFEVGPGFIRWFALVLLVGWGAAMLLAGRALSRSAGDAPPVDAASVPTT